VPLNRSVSTQDYGRKLLLRENFATFASFLFKFFFVLSLLRFSHTIFWGEGASAS
jgi:hypothetical protein